MFKTMDNCSPMSFESAGRENNVDAADNWRANKNNRKKPIYNHV